MIKTVSRLAAIALLGISLPALSEDAMSAIKEAAMKQANTRMAEKLNIPTAAPQGARAYIVSPADGATVSSPFTIVFGLSGMGIAPAGVQAENTGHHHLLIDNPTVNFAVPMGASDQLIHFGGGQTETSLSLPKGTHTLQIVLGDWKHQSFNPTVASETITVTVQ